MDPKVAFQAKLTVTPQVSDTEHQLFQICRNGLLLFDLKWLPRWPYNFGERWWLKKVSMLAPYWSLTDSYYSFVSQGVSRVYYHEYSDSDPGSFHMLNTATSDVKRLLKKPLPTDFKASWVLVTTWENLRPYHFPASMANMVREKEDHALQQRNVIIY